MTGIRARRVVVVGHGMAAARFVAGLTAAGTGASITVVGDEPRGGYNRVLLTTLLSGGIDRAGLFGVGAGSGGGGEVTVRDGVRVTAIDRDTRTVRCSDETELPYDVLVLATGSQAVVPPVTGLLTRDGPGLGGQRLRPGCHTFRTLADCDAILADASRAASAVVFGGGILGLEIASALTARGVHAQIVHKAGFLMDVQLDPDGGAALRRVLSDFGIACHAPALPRAVLGREQDVHGVVLADGTPLDCDMVVLACGARPATALAASAGLATARGILVDGTMRSITDPRVLAIGDCAEYQGQVFGLVAPALEQAAVAAATAAGRIARYQGSPPVARLKAAGIELAAMGDVSPEPDCGGPSEVVKFVDPTRGRYFKLVVTGGRLTGAVTLGDPDAAAAVTVAYDRQSVLPPDRARLIFGAAAGDAGTSPADLPDSALVCRCNAVTAGQIRACAASGTRTVAGIARATLASTGCGTCVSTLSAVAGAGVAVPAPATDPALATVPAPEPAPALTP